MYHRPSIMAAAFVAAAARAEHAQQDLSKPKVDHWVPRRVAMNAERPGFAIVTELDRRPYVAKPRKELTTAEKQGIADAVLDMCETAAIEAAGPRMGIIDGEESID
jgi:hypothetical protein